MWNLKKFTQMNLFIKQTHTAICNISKLLLYGTENCIQYLVITYNGKESENIYIQQDHFAIYQKLTQHCKSAMLVTQSCPTLCNPMDCSFHHRILQARIVEWVAIPFSRAIFPIQGLKLDLLCCRQTLYHLSRQGSPKSTILQFKK